MQKDVCKNKFSSAGIKRIPVVNRDDGEEVLCLHKAGGIEQGADGIHPQG